MATDPEQRARPRWGSAAVVIAALAAATLLAGGLEAGLGLDNASSVYLLAVAIVALWAGTIPAVVAAVGSFLAYNFLFVEPRFSLTVARADELLTLFLLLFVGVIISRLAGLQRDRAQEAHRREREARALFGVSRELATADLDRAMRTIIERLKAETEMTRIWIGLGPTPAQERPAADSTQGEPIPPFGTHALLRRDHEEGSAAWTRIHPTMATRRGRTHAADGSALFRIELRAAGEVVGSLWCQRDASSGEPYLEQTRLFAVAADQIAQAVRRDRLTTVAAAAEIDRRSDQLRSALLDSVSHDLRTPLASIRAAAGSLADPSIHMDPEQMRATARSIDEEAAQLNRLVGTLLDMSRIQAGSLELDLEVMPLHDLVEPVVERMRRRLEEHRLVVDLPPELPDVIVDATFVAQSLTNVLENAIRHTPRGGPIAIRAEADVPEVVSLIVEDGGPGVPFDALPRLFERFYRASGNVGESRRGFGLGLAVVRGLIEGTGGRVRATESRLGGLAIEFQLPAATRGSVPAATG